MRFGGVGIGGGIWNRYPGQKKNTWSGSMALSIPFGNSDKYFGGAVSVYNPDLGKNTRFGKNGTIGLALSKWLARNTIASAGIVSLVPWGSYKDTSKSYYGVVTHEIGFNISQRRHQASFSGGLGTGSFAPLISKRADHDSKLYPFLNASFNIAKNLAIAADYASQTYSAGISYNKIIYLPFSFMAYASNIRHTDKAPSTSYGLRVSTGIPLPAGLNG